MVKNMTQKTTKKTLKKHAKKTLKQTCEKCILKEDCRLYPNPCLEYFKCPRYKIQGLD